MLLAEQQGGQSCEGQPTPLGDLKEGLGDLMGQCYLATAPCYQLQSSAVGPAMEKAMAASMGPGWEKPPGLSPPISSVVYQEGEISWGLKICRI